MSVQLGILSSACVVFVLGDEEVSGLAVVVSALATDSRECKPFYFPQYFTHALFGWASTRRPSPLTIATIETFLGAEKTKS